jgi:pSer/pThr/pTyr-binding forkhead associated (FHA) protein
MFVLVVQSGKHVGRRVKLPPGDVIVGRDEESRVRIASSEVSREHCRLIVEADHVRVIDLDSRNGTYVNGVPISGETELSSGSTLTVGPMTFKLEGGTGAPVVRKPAEVAVARTSEEKAKQGLSDDEIASLLSDDFGAVSASDTTVHGEDSVVIGEGPSTRQTPVSPARPPRREFKSIAEEGREIIRLYRESLEAKSAGESQG